MCICRYVWLNEYSGQILPILALIALRVVVGAGDFLIQKFGKKKKDKMQEMADEYGKSRAQEFNVGVGGNRKDTGVRYADVAGIDSVKSDIEETMRMILGDAEYDAIGAKPPRVQSSSVLMMQLPAAAPPTPILGPLNPLMSCNSKAWLTLCAVIRAACAHVCSASMSCCMRGNIDGCGSCWTCESTRAC